MAMITETDKEKVLLRDLNSLQTKIELMRSHLSSNIIFMHELINHTDDKILKDAAIDRLAACEMAYQNMYGISFAANREQCARNSEYLRNLIGEK